MSVKSLKDRYPKRIDDRGRCRVVRTSTIPTSLDTFCRGTLALLSEKYDLIAISSPGEALDAVAKREGVRTVAVPMERHISPLRDLRSLWKMYRTLRRERPMMVHSITPKAGLVSMVAARLAGVPVRVHTFTGLIWPTSKGLKRLILKTVDRILCASATHIIPEGEGVRRDIIEGRITCRPLRILGYGNIRGIDPNYYDLTNDVVKAAAELRRSETITFIFVGRLVHDKGIDELVEAFDRLRSQPASRKARLILVGPAENEIDPLSPQTLRIIDTNPDIEAVGAQSDIRPWLAASDVLVFPSHREGFPNVPLEAGALGLPSIVTDINGSNEIITDGENGIVIPNPNTNPDSVIALEVAMRRMIDYDDMRLAMAKAARPRILQRWTTDIVRTALTDFYDEILKK